MRFVTLWLICLVILQGCYLDDEESQTPTSPPVVEEVIEEVEEEEIVLHEFSDTTLYVTSSQSGVLKGAMSEDVLQIEISGKLLIPQFSEIYEKSVRCSWEERFTLYDLEAGKPFPAYGYSSLLNPVKKTGYCLVKVRDFLGYQKESLIFSDDLMDLQLKVMNGDNLYLMDEILSIEEGVMSVVLTVEPEYLQDDGTIKLIVESLDYEFIRTGVLEILEDESERKNIQITETLGFPLPVSSAEKIQMKLEITQYE